MFRLKDDLNIILSVAYRIAMASDRSVDTKIHKKSHMNQTITVTK